MSLAHPLRITSPWVFPTLLAISAGCTTLGPMPTTTAISAIPNARAGGEIQAGIVPAYYLSDTAHDTNDGGTTGQLAALLDPAELLHVPGLIVGGRLWGDSGDSAIEPMIGYRRKISSGVAMAGIAYGTKAHATQSGASYKATRAGGEFAVDAEMMASAGGWFSLHGQVAASATYVTATGEYCVDSDGIGTDCGDTSTPIMGELDGVYPALTGTLALDFARGKDSAFHHARLAFLFGGTALPRIRDGKQEDADVRATVGVTLTLGFGDAK